MALLPYPSAHDRTGYVAKIMQHYPEDLNHHPTEGTSMATATKGSTEARLRELIGDAHTEALMARWGWDFLFIPQPGNIGPDHPIAQCIGLDAAHRLAEEFGGLRVLVPSGYRQRLAARNQRIRAARAAGATVPQLSREFCLSPRQVHAIIGPRSASPTDGAATR